MAINLGRKNGCDSVCPRRPETGGVMANVYLWTQTLNPSLRSQSPALPHGADHIVQCNNGMVGGTSAREARFLNAGKEGKRNIRIGRIAVELSDFETIDRLRRVLRYTLNSLVPWHIITSSLATGIQLTLSRSLCCWF